MSTIEMTFHHLVRVKADTGRRDDNNWLDLELYNNEGESVLLTIFAPRDTELRGSFNALRDCLIAEFNPGERDEEIHSSSTSRSNNPSDDIPF